MARIHMATQGKTALEIAAMIESVSNVEVIKITITGDVATIDYRDIPMGFGEEIERPIDDSIFDDGYWYAYDDDYSSDDL